MVGGGVKRKGKVVPIKDPKRKKKNLPRREQETKQKTTKGRQKGKGG